MVPHQKLIAVVGPTGSGKTGLSLRLAKKFCGEVISADSRQVYRGLDIGTEKVTSEEMQGVPHHCIDIASPRRAFTVEQWRRHAENALSQIDRRGHVPFVVGGTGFYVDALVYDSPFPEVSPNAELRKQLCKKSTDELLALLQQQSPARAATIESKNPRRLIRALEIAAALGNVPTPPKKTPRYDALWLSVDPGTEILDRRIEERLDATLRRGLVAEVHTLWEAGLSWKRLEELGLEYRACAQMFQGVLSESELRERMLTDLRRYARRQRTWLKRERNIHWFEDGVTHYNKISRLVGDFLAESLQH